jgi:hypothetical protein
VKAWKRAVETLPKENVTPAELKQREQYEDSLKTALLAKSKAENTPVRGRPIKANEHKFPWQVAYEMQRELEASKEASSVGLIYCLYDLFVDFSSSGLGYRCCVQCMFAFSQKRLLCLFVPGIF